MMATTRLVGMGSPLFASANGSLGRMSLASTRNMATLRQIEQRLKSVKNIQKITASMKMIASTKLNRATRSMETAKVYGVANKEFFKNAETEKEEGDSKTLYVTCSSDRGLCGGIHSSISKASRRIMENDSEGKVVVLGEKSKAQLQRMVPQRMVLSFNQIGRDVPTFADAQAIAETITSSGVDYDKVKLIYNQYESVISYKAVEMDLFSEAKLKGSPGLAAYEIEDDVLNSLAEYQLASGIFAALVEGHACEIAARRNAMDNASKNAGDMIENLTMTFNRTRQSVITTQLIDIITGAAAME